MCSRPKTCSASRMLWTLNRRRRFAGFESPPRATGRTWSNWNCQVLSHRSSAAKAQRPPPRAQTSRRTAAGMEGREGPGRWLETGGDGGSCRAAPAPRRRRGGSGRGQLRRGRSGGRPRTPAALRALVHGEAPRSLPRHPDAGRRPVAPVTPASLIIRHIVWRAMVGGPSALPCEQCGRRPLDSGVVTHPGISARVVNNRICHRAIARRATHLDRSPSLTRFSLDCRSWAQAPRERPSRTRGSPGWLAPSRLTQARRGSSQNAATGPPGAFPDAPKTRAIMVRHWR